MKPLSLTILMALLSSSAIYPTFNDFIKRDPASSKETELVAREVGLPSHIEQEEERLHDIEMDRLLDEAIAAEKKLDEDSADKEFEQEFNEVENQFKRLNEEIAEKERQKAEECKDKNQSSADLSKEEIEKLLEIAKEVEEKEKEEKEEKRVSERKAKKRKDSYLDYHEKRYDLAQEMRSLGMNPYGYGQNLGFGGYGQAYGYGYNGPFMPSFMPVAPALNFNANLVNTQYDMFMNMAMYNMLDRTMSGGSFADKIVNNYYFKSDPYPTYGDFVERRGNYYDQQKGYFDFSSPGSKFVDSDPFLRNYLGQRQLPVPHIQKSQSNDGSVQIIGV